MLCTLRVWDSPIIPHCCMDVFGCSHVIKLCTCLVCCTSNSLLLRSMHTMAIYMACYNWCSPPHDQLSQWKHTFNSLVKFWEWHRFNFCLLWNQGLPSNNGQIFLQQVIPPSLVYWPRDVSRKKTGIPQANKKMRYGMKKAPAHTCGIKGAVFIYQTFAKVGCKRLVWLPAPSLNHGLHWFLQFFETVNILTSIFLYFPLSKASQCMRPCLDWLSIKSHQFLNAVVQVGVRSQRLYICRAKL